MCRAFALSGLFAGLAFAAVTAGATFLFSREMVDTPGGATGLGFLVGFSGGLLAGGIALVVVFAGTLVALWPRGSGTGREPPR